MIPQYTKNKMKNILKNSDITYFEPQNASNYEGYGNSFYYKVGSRVHLHIGIKIENTANTQIYTLPEKYRPFAIAVAIGTGSSFSNFASIQVDNQGKVYVNSQHGYANIDIEYDTLNN